MMARINVQKIRAHRSPRVVADAEAKQVTVECQCCRYVLHKHQDVPHAEWTSSEARNHAAWAERRVSNVRSGSQFLRDVSTCAAGAGVFAQPRSVPVF